MTPLAPAQEHEARSARRAPDEGCNCGLIPMDDRDHTGTAPAAMPLQEDELKAAIRAQDRDKIKKIIAARDRHRMLNEVREAPQCFCLQASDDRGETLLVSASTFGCRCNGWFHHQCIWKHFKRCSNSELGQLLHAWRWQDHVVACPYCRTLVRVSRPPPRQRYRNLL